MTHKEFTQLLETLAARFSQYPQRHPKITWSQVLARLEQSHKLDQLAAMEASGGEPDVVAIDAHTGAIMFYDCAAESPGGRRSLCYDQPALDARKQNKPGGNAIETAKALGIELLTEDEYRQLQTLGEFDKKTSSWIATPAAIRQLGGALFCDRRYNQVFTYHNGADAYYAARGFRGKLSI